MLARAHAVGDEVRTVIAGYHWFTDWGRDTMISLEGLTLTTGRHAEAGWILRTFAHYMRDGLIPNMFPEGENEGLTIRPTRRSGSFMRCTAIWRRPATDTLRVDAAEAREIVARHLEGTRFGIGVDPADGLLRQGAAGYQLTWMDAKVDDWVVTPRRGKAVEINALWYNALRLMEAWLQEYASERYDSRDSPIMPSESRIVQRRFWYEQGQYLYDVVDGEAGETIRLSAEPVARHLT